VLTKTPKKNGYEISATIVTPIVGELPSEKAMLELTAEPEGSKWGAEKGSKWMKKK
jgi:hypothetical protein